MKQANQGKYKRFFLILKLEVILCRMSLCNKENCLKYAMNFINITFLHPSGFSFCLGFSSDFWILGEVIDVVEENCQIDLQFKELAFWKIIFAE